MNHLKEIPKNLLAIGEKNADKPEVRKSLALYYYTNGRPAGETKFRLKRKSTLFKARAGSQEDNKVVKRMSKIEKFSCTAI